jgi:hypothetical protein
MGNLIGTDNLKLQVSIEKKKSEHKNLNCVFENFQSIQYRNLKISFRKRILEVGRSDLKS